MKHSDLTFLATVIFLAPALPPLLQSLFGLACSLFTLYLVLKNK